MISFSDTSLLSSTILNLNENEKETQTSNELIKKAFKQIFQMNILPVWKKPILK